MKSKRSAWLDAAQRKQENCVFLIRLNWPFECATAWVNKSLPPPFQDMRVIRLNISLNVWNLYSAFYCQWQISQKITCIASCQREKIRRVLFLQCTPVYLHSFNSPSNMLLIFLPRPYFLYSSVWPSPSKPSSRKQNMQPGSICVVASAALDTAARMWCFSIVNHTPTHPYTYKHSFPEDSDGWGAH